MLSSLLCNQYVLLDAWALSDGWYRAPAVMWRACSGLSEIQEELLVAESWMNLRVSNLYYLTRKRAGPVSGNKPACRCCSTKEKMSERERDKRALWSFTYMCISIVTTNLNKDSGVCCTWSYSSYRQHIQSFFIAGWIRFDECVNGKMSAMDFSFCLVTWCNSFKLKLHYLLTDIHWTDNWLLWCSYAFLVWNSAALAILAPHYHINIRLHSETVIYHRKWCKAIFNWS